jgi:methyltransferase (TIGR00027 family)
VARGPRTIAVVANPISKTAFYTLGARAFDAARARPICGDTFAEHFMDEDARAVWSHFAGLSGPNVSTVVRHRVIDDRLREVIAEAPGALIVVLGAGFDTRAFRLPGGRWIEIDEAPVITRKEARLPAGEAPNPLERVPVDFSAPAWMDAVRRLATNDRVIVVVEGVWMYLSDEQRDAILALLGQVFPRHELLVDLIRARFVARYSADLHAKIEALGTRFTHLEDAPERRFERAGYRCLASTSLVGKAVDDGILRLPRVLVRHVLRELRDGYRVFAWSKG